ncbi:MAG: hypothetical protein HKN62_02865 [Phycisphaerales bacterium]|nr:hypothetical protein [Phycisphaerales bacterium]
MITTALSLRRARQSLLAGVILGLAAGPAFSATILVPQDFTTIQEAVDAATNGDRIIVGNGVYTGVGNRDIDFLGKQVVVESLNGPGSCIIDCEGLGRAFIFQTGETVDSIVRGIGMRNGMAASGGAVLMMSASPTIVGCVFEDNTALGTTEFVDGKGGAIACFGASSPLIDRCGFFGNRAIASDDNPIGGLLTGIGGAIALGGGTDALITTSTFVGNQAMSPAIVGSGFGGAISTELFASPLSLTVLGSKFKNNSASIAGGAVFLFGSNQVTIEDTAFASNSGQSSGAIAFQTGMDLTVRRSLFLENTAREEITFGVPDVQEQIGGGAIGGGTDSVLLLEDSIFLGNRALAGRGGAVSCVDNTTSLIIRCHFEDNEAALQGGAVTNQEAPSVAPFSSDLLSNPSVMEMVDCMLLGNSSGVMGGAVANLEGSLLTMTTSTFGDGNTAPVGATFVSVGRSSDDTTASVTTLNQMITECTLSIIETGIAVDGGLARTE